MGLIQSLRAAMFGERNEQNIARRAAQGYSVGSDYVSHKFGTATDWDVWARIYAENPVVQACALTYALTLPEAPLGVISGENINTEHALPKLIYGDDAAQTIARIATNVCIGGNSYGLKVYDNGVVDRVQHLSDKYIRVVPAIDGTVSHYLIAGNGGRWIEIPREHVVHITGFWIHPDRPWMGMSPIELTYTSSETYNEAQRVSYSIFKNDAVPKTVIMYPEELDQEQAALVSASFTRKHGGSNRGTVGVLSGGATINRVAMDYDELGLGSQFGALEARICGVYRVHPIVAMTQVGLSSSTYSNFKQASKDFTALSRVPLWSLWASQLQRGFAKEYPSVALSFDLSNIEALQPDANERAASTLDAYGRGVITRDEAREVLGYEPEVAAAPVAEPTEPTATSDVASQAMNGSQVTSLVDIVSQAVAGTIPVSAAKAITQAAFPLIPASEIESIFADIAPESKAEAVPNEDNAATSTVDVFEGTQEHRTIDAELWRRIEFQSADDATWYRAIDDLSESHAQALAVELRKAFAKLEKHLIKKHTRSGLAVRAEVAPFDVEAWEREFLAATQAVRLRMVDDIIESALRTVDANFDDIESVFDAIERAGVAASADKIKESVTTVKDEMKELLTANAGKSSSELAALIRDRFQNVYAKSRTDMIARTTATATTGAVTMDTYAEMNAEQDDESRVIVRTWLAFPGARGAHGDASGKDEDEDGLFTVGGDRTPYPAGPGLSAKNACNCRCITRARRKGKA